MSAGLRRKGTIYENYNTPAHQPNLFCFDIFMVLLCDDDWQRMVEAQRLVSESVFESRPAHRHFHDSYYAKFI